MSARCNELSHRFTARAAWFAAPGHQVGLYIATEEAGIIFVQVPVKVWHACMRADEDVNGNPIPQVPADSLAQCTAEADAIRRQHTPTPPKKVYLKRGRPCDVVQIAATVSDFHASGLTLYGYAKKHGLPFATLRGWVAMIRQAGEPKLGAIA